MAMFDAKREGRVDGNESMTLIGEEAYVHGQLSAKGSLRVEGSVEGDITDAVSVEIGKKGRVKGSIAAESVSIAGELEGDIVASRHIEILAQARLHGDIRTPNLRVEDGAIFEGTCSMASSAAQPKSGPAEGESAL